MFAWSFLYFLQSVKMSAREYLKTKNPKINEQATTIRRSRTSATSKNFLKIMKIDCNRSFSASDDITNLKSDSRCCIKFLR